MVFIQALGYYITPALVGGADDQMISYFIAFYASRTVNWGMAAALSIMLLAATLALYAVYNRLVGVEQDAARADAMRTRNGDRRRSGSGSPRAGLARADRRSCCVFLVAPILIIVPLSFSSGSFFYYPLPGFSLRWYQDFFTSSFWLPSRLEQPDRRHVGDACSRPLLGTLAALGIWRARFPGAGAGAGDADLADGRAGDHRRRRRLLRVRAARAHRRLRSA